MSVEQAVGRRPCAGLDPLDLRPLLRLEGGDGQLGPRLLALDLDVGPGSSGLHLVLGLTPSTESSSSSGH